MELVESQPLLEWLANNYKSFGATLEIITDKSQEGSQFVRGFGGIGGKLPFNFLPVSRETLQSISFAFTRHFTLQSGFTKFTRRCSTGRSDIRFGRLLEYHIDLPSAVSDHLSRIHRMKEFFFSK